MINSISTYILYSIYRVQLGSLQLMWLSTQVDEFSRCFHLNLSSPLSLGTVYICKHTNFCKYWCIWSWFPCQRRQMLFNTYVHPFCSMSNSTNGMVPFPVPNTQSHSCTFLSLFLSTLFVHIVGSSSIPPFLIESSNKCFIGYSV